MKKETTFQSLKTGLRGAAAMLALFTASSSFGQIIYSNGGLSTGATTASGVAAPTGYTWSEAQSNTGNTTESNTNAGFGGIFTTAGTTSLQLADNFTVPEGQEWNVTGFNFYGYQTGYTGTTIPIDQLRVQIFSSDPSVTGAVSVAGNMTTNVLDAANSADAMMYRVFNTVTPAPGTPSGTTRKIWRFRGNLTTTLPAGTYWVVYQVHATNDMNIFFPPVTIPGTRGLDGWNAKQNTVATTANPPVLGWISLVDAGNPATAPDVAQDMPFDVIGTVTNLGLGENALASKVSIYPNPVKNSINLLVSPDVTIEGAQIYDLTGKLVQTVKGNTGGITTINATDLSSGTYFLRLKSGSTIATKKFVKQ